MVECGRGCHLPLHSTVGRMYGEPCDTECHSMTSGTFQGGYSAMFTASRRVLKGARRVLYYLKLAKREHCFTPIPHSLTFCSSNLNFLSSLSLRS